MPIGKRPPLYWKTLSFGLPPLAVTAVILASDGLLWVAMLLVVVGLALFFWPWLLAPYSKVAHRIAWPTSSDFERSERVADRLGSVPVFGAVWRWAERVTNDSGRRRAEEYRRWQRERGESE